VGRTVFDAVSILLPLNLVVFGMISERGILNVRGLARLVAILVQCLIVACIGLPALCDVAVGLEYKFVNGNLLSGLHYLSRHCWHSV